ncbi:MAG: reverse transcriptase domain-containing protein [Desulfobacter postgatei]|uniref:reverse transcriptase domain-containing protein n=1 Tax=Desulfobacter postgatei TaxID=2293 RepID=UPI0023EF7E99|nr:reverse transcriptase domain-containing protein [Desulfobacter postgatei]MDD4273324.1 reverse transcriptase domain-containing protein [Desulfobacter postgatei]
MGDLLKKAASPEVLNASWKRLKSDNTVWAEGISKKEMEKNFVFHITQLANELAAGKYRPSQVRIFSVLKGDGKKRIISALTLRDKLAQRAVLTVLNPIGEAMFHHDSYGYRPGRSIDSVMRRVRENLDCGYYWLVDADIKSFFDMIPHHLLKKKLKTIIPDRELLDLVFKWLDVGAPRTGILSRRRGIPQGGVISPFLCNFYLTGFDNYLTNNNLPFVRFADDFLVFTPSKKDAVKALACVKKGLKKLDLVLNEKKTRIVPSSPRVIFLGQKLPGKKKAGKSKK